MPQGSCERCRSTAGQAAASTECSDLVGHRRNRTCRRHRHPPAPGVQHIAPCRHDGCSVGVAPFGRAPSAHPKGREKTSGRARCCELERVPRQGTDDQHAKRLWMRCRARVSVLSMRGGSGGGSSACCGPILPPAASSAHADRAADPSSGPSCPRVLGANSKLPWILQHPRMRVATAGPRTRLLHRLNCDKRLHTEYVTCSHAQQGTALGSKLAGGLAVAACRCLLLRRIAALLLLA